jgi:hypothetical protein
LQVSQRTKDKLLAIFLLLGMIFITIAGFQPKHQTGECGYYQFVIGGIKLFPVSCTGDRNILANYMGYIMMIFNPITITIVAGILILKDEKNG